MNCKNCYGAIAKMIEPKDAEIARLTQQLFAANETIKQQEEQIAELKLDAERLDSGRIILTSTDEEGDIYQTQHRGVDLRAAIDAALAKPMPKGMKAASRHANPNEADGTPD